MVELLLLLFFYFSIVGSYAWNHRGCRTALKGRLYDVVSYRSCSDEALQGMTIVPLHTNLSDLHFQSVYSSLQLFLDMLHLIW